MKPYRKKAYCAHCHKKYKQWSHALEAGYVYCSKACSREASGEQHPPYIDDRGYVMAWDSRVKRYRLEHRIVWEQQHNAWSLPSHLVIHHRDGNRVNNSPENLELMGLFDHVNEHHGFR